MTETKTAIERESSFFRPYYLPSGEQLEQIIVYSKGVIKYKCSCGWLECEERGDIIKFILNQRPVKANKENLNRTDNFYLCGKRDYKHDKGFILYLNADTENIKIEVDPDFKERFKTETSISYRKTGTLKTANPMTYTKAKWKGEERTTTEETTQEIRVFIDSKSERTPLGKRADQLGAELKELNIDIRAYEVEKLLEHYDLKRKVTP